MRPAKKRFSPLNSTLILEPQFRIPHSEFRILFTESWWLDAVSGGPSGWRAAESRHGNGPIRGFLPYYLSKKWGFQKIGLPPLTPWLGCFIDSPGPPAKSHTRFSFEKMVARELISQLPNGAFLKLNFHWSSQNWWPFLNAGFRATTRFTWILENLGDFKTIETGFNHSIRRNETKAEKLLLIEKSDDLETLFSLTQKTLGKYGQPVPFSLNLLKNVDNALKINAFRQIWLARRRADGQPVAAIYVAWTASGADLLITASDPDFRECAATFSLFFEALRFLSDRTPLFDFNGSMTESVADSYRSFGAVPRGYAQLSRWPGILNRQA